MEKEPIDKMIKLLDDFTKQIHCVSLSGQVLSSAVKENLAINKKMCVQYRLDDVETHWGFIP